MKHKTLFILLLFSAVIFDRFFKVLSLKSEGGFFIIPKLFQFTFFANHRLAFSLPAPQNLTIILSIIIILILSLYFFRYLKTGKRGLALAISAIILGALSNLYDRVAFGYVVDYFHLWPISYFNLADIMIGGGIIIIICHFSRHPERNGVKRRI